MSLETLIVDAEGCASQARRKEAHYVTHPPMWSNGKCSLDDPKPRAGTRRFTWWERREPEQKASRTGKEES